ncbi:MAG: TatD family hydrolase [Proteobacteria bacterium]|nr:TatD family hydrolase [Pseudomonadota bacterium]
MWQCKSIIRVVCHILRTACLSFLGNAASDRSRTRPAPRQFDDAACPNRVSDRNVRGQRVDQELPGSPHLPDTDRALQVLIDSHCHLDAPEFDADRGAVIARALAVGVVAQIVPAVAARGWPKLRALCESGGGLYPAYGLHPMYLAEHEPRHLLALRHALRVGRPVAVGECGLDFHVAGLDRQRQQFYFEEQIKTARDFDLPVIVHARKALDAVIATLRRFGGPRANSGNALRGVVHSFSGSPEQARQLFQLGYHLGIGGPVTYERAQRLRRIVASMPIEYLLLETDAPDQPDAWHRGQRNEPSRLTVVRDVVAQLRRQPPEDIARAATDNARRLFGLLSTV